MMIGITGASGQLGGAILDHLQRIKPWAMKVRGLTRFESEFSRIAGRTDQCATATFGAPQEELQRAFSGLHTLLIVSIEGEDNWRERVQAEAVQAAARAGVRRIVYTSFFDVAPDSPSRVAQVHRRTEEAVRATGCRWTFLRNGPYLENAALRLAFAAKHGGAFQMAAGDARLPFIARNDLGLAAACALVDDGHPESAFRLGGPQLLTFHELAQIVGGEARPSSALRADRRCDLPKRVEVDGHGTRAGGASRGLRPGYAARLHDGFNPRLRTHGRPSSAPGARGRRAIRHGRIGMVAIPTPALGVPARNQPFSQTARK